jgi:predicted DNA-binding transcriptional regulator AlpA
VTVAARQAVIAKNVREYIQGAEIAARLDIAMSTLTRWVQDGWFPRPARLGPSGRHRRWRREVVEEFLRSLEAGEDA